MQVRRLGPGDEDFAVRLVKEVQLAEGRPEVADFDYLKPLLTNPGVLIAAALEDDGTPLGFVLGYRLPRMDGRADMLYVHEVEVVAGRRREGIGRAMVEEMLRIGRAEGLLKLFLFTGRDNHPARSLYASAGGEPDEKAVILWWNLDSGSLPQEPPD